ncbi:MAG: hypothetical protein KatS3mg109_0781 [Pirellulaceae bacterium]|nr:MAG: hypothetical protein KatS3mg109_0781 [Pirellulaceae bacterium]
MFDFLPVLEELYQFLLAGHQNLTPRDYSTLALAGLVGALIYTLWRSTTRRCCRRGQTVPSSSVSWATSPLAFFAASPSVAGSLRQFWPAFWGRCSFRHWSKRSSKWWNFISIESERTMKAINLLPVATAAMIVSDPSALAMMTVLAIIALIIKRRRLTN